MYAAPIVFERNAYEVPVFTRVHDFMWSGAGHPGLGVLCVGCCALPNRFVCCGGVVLQAMSHEKFLTLVQSHCPGPIHCLCAC